MEGDMGGASRRLTLEEARRVGMDLDEAMLIARDVREKVEDGERGEYILRSVDFRASSQRVVDFACSMLDEYVAELRAIATKRAESIEMGKTRIRLDEESNVADGV